MDSSSSPDSFPTSPNAIFLPICAALVIAANYVPLLLLLRVKKVAACTLVLVLVVGNVFTLINAILWPNDNTDGWYDGVGLCDVQVVLKVPLATLLATCSAYISLDLARALDTDNPRLHETARTKRRRLAFELVFCFAVPILQAPLHYLVQANRFGVITVYGCADIVDDSWPAIVMLAIWPLLFGILNCYFAGRSNFASVLVALLTRDSFGNASAAQASRRPLRHSLEYRIRSQCATVSEALLSIRFHPRCLFSRYYLLLLPQRGLPIYVLFLVSGARSRNLERDLFHHHGYGSPYPI